MAKFYGRLSLIPGILRASKLSVLKIDKNCNCMGLFHRHVFWVFFGNRMTIFYKTFGGLGSLMYEGLIPEMRYCPYINNSIRF